MKPIRTYEVAVDGWGEAKYSARSPGKARARAFSDWRGASGSSMGFGEFLTVSRVRRVPDPPGCGERIVVNGETVTRVYDPCGNSNRVSFMRDGSDAVFCSHPYDVKPLDPETEHLIAAVGALEGRVA